MRRPELRFATIGLVGTLLLGACNLINGTPDDNAIVSEIQAKLYEDPVLKTRDIHVTSQKGVVVLTGSVATDLEKGSVEQAANQAKGVKQLIDQLTVSAPAAQVAPPAAPAAPAARHHQSRRARPSQAYADVPAAAQRAAAPATPAPVEAAQPAPQPAPQPVQATVPAGTVVTVRMIDSIDSARNHPGDEFDATVNSPVVA